MGVPLDRHDALVELLLLSDVTSPEAMKGVLAAPGSGISLWQISTFLTLFFRGRREPLDLQALGLVPSSAPAAHPREDPHESDRLTRLELALTERDRRDEEARREELHSRELAAIEMRHREQMDAVLSRIEALAAVKEAPPAPPPPTPADLVKGTFETFAALRGFMENEGYRKGDLPVPPPGALDTLARSPMAAKLGAELVVKVAALLDSKLQESQAKTSRIVLDGELFRRDQLMREQQYELSKIAAVAPAPPAVDVTLPPMKPPIPQTDPSKPQEGARAARGKAAGRSP
ncbi:MAG: hypothetical protein Q8R28_16410 [Dehalococcoidia bacterium]|nr:hypothetical protein [Dehalococcoidia bacterium]